MFTVEIERVPVRVERNAAGNGKPRVAFSAVTCEHVEAGRIARYAKDTGPNDAVAVVSVPSAM